MASPGVPESEQGWLQYESSGAMTVWAAIKVYEVATKVWTEAIITRKSSVEMWINSTSGANVMAPT